LIRIAVIADTLGRARQLASLLGDDERLEIVDVRTSNARMVPAMVDVIVAVNLTVARAFGTSAPVVLVSDTVARPSEQIRALLPLAASPAQISAAIEAAAHDLTVLTHEQAIRLLPTGRARSEDDDITEDLTTRELQVLRMIADGSGNREIAIVLGISEHTVKFHVAQILSKLNAATRTEAVSLGIRRGLIPV
jgi:DNA-binding CsgD family transcriptional regulator